MGCSPQRSGSESAHSILSYTFYEQPKLDKLHLVTTGKNLHRKIYLLLNFRWTKWLFCLFQLHISFLWFIYMHFCSLPLTSNIFSLAWIEITTSVVMEDKICCLCTDCYCWRHLVPMGCRAWCWIVVIWSHQCSTNNIPQGKHTSHSNYNVILFPRMRATIHQEYVEGGNSII